MMVHDRNTKLAAMVRFGRRLDDLAERLKLLGGHPCHIET